jgi:6-pyruvoyl-tetrahydropterin synthase
VFTVCVRDHVMIAHSFSGDVFGPAQRLHGATYVIDVEFRRRELDADGIVVDIGAAGAALRAILDRINYRNLDDESAFAGTNTTTERLARYVFDRMREEIEAGRLGAVAREIESLRVVFHESHVAWAAYEGQLRGASERR